MLTPAPATAPPPRSSDNVLYLTVRRSDAEPVKPGPNESWDDVSRITVHRPHPLDGEGRSLTSEDGGVCHLGQTPGQPTGCPCSVRSSRRATWAATRLLDAYPALGSCPMSSDQ